MLYKNKYYLIINPQTLKTKYLEIILKLCLNTFNNKYFYMSLQKTIYIINNNKVGT